MSKEAAQRIKEQLKAADDGNYPNAWWFYMSRRDVEAVTNGFLVMLGGKKKRKGG